MASIIEWETFSGSPGTLAVSSAKLALQLTGTQKTTVAKSNGQGLHEWLPRALLFRRSFDELLLVGKCPRSSFKDIRAELQILQLLKDACYI